MRSAVVAVSRFFPLLVALSLGCGSSEAPPRSEPVAIGLVMPLSGPAAIGPWDVSARLAINEINEGGGVDGRPLELLVRDSREGTPGAVDVVRAQIEDLTGAGAVAIAGPGLSASLAAVTDLIVARHVPLVGLTTAAPALTTLADDDLVYRVIPSCTFEGAVLAGRIRRDGITSLSIIHADDIAAAALAAALRARFEQEGGHVLVAVPYPSDKIRDFAGEVTQLFAPGLPGAIAIVGTSLDSAAIVAAIAGRDPLPKPGLYGVDGNASEVFLGNAPPNYVAGMRGTSSAGPAGSAAFQAWTAAYRRSLGADPSPGLEKAYDAVYLTALALLQARESSAAGVKARLREVSRPDSPTPVVIGVGAAEWRKAIASVGADLDFRGASGPLDLDAAGDVASGSYRIWEITQSAEGLHLTELEEVPFP